MERASNCLNNINLKIPVGSSLNSYRIYGSGKSSLINLIPRLFDVTKGEILIDGINVKTNSPKVYYAKVLD